MATFLATPALSIERLVIPGTGDSLKLLREAARYFLREHPEVIIDIPESVGSVGGITSWQELGNCPDHKIYVANREEGDSSRILIEANLPDFKRIPKLAGEIIYSTPEALHIVEDHPGP